MIIKSIPDGDNLIDVLYNRRTGSIRRFSKRRIDTRNVNGTGDTFGSAIATYIARKYDLEAAVERAEIFINESIAYGSGYRFGPGYGPVHPFYRVPATAPCIHSTARLTSSKGKTAATP